MRRTRRYRVRSTGRTVRIRRYSKYGMVTMSIEEFLANFEPAE